MNTATAFDRTADAIDSRDLIERIDELDAIEERDEEENDELAILRAFAEEAEGYCADWLYGETLIRDDYFKAYAQELAEDIGALPKDAAWPASFIDWDAAAEALQQDYTSAELDGVTYWFR